MRIQDRAQPLAHLARMHRQNDHVTGFGGIEQSASRGLLVGLRAYPLGGNAGSEQSALYQRRHLAQCAPAKHQRKLLDHDAIRLKTRGGARQLGNGTVVSVSRLSQQQTQPLRP